MQHIDDPELVPYRTIVESPRSAMRFWIHPYVTVIITAPMAILTGYQMLWYGGNALFANLVMVLWNPLVWFVLSPLWLGWTFMPSVLMYRLFEWLPEIWYGRRPLWIRLLAIPGAWIGILVVSGLIYSLFWGVLHWIGAGEKAMDLIDSGPWWLSIFGVADPHYDRYFLP